MNECCINANSKVSLFYIIPPIPPIPPPGGIAGAASLGSGFSLTTAYVVINNPEIDAAFCKAFLVTFVGSITPLETKSVYSSLLASKP